jgi:hypothetical protein
VKSTRPARRAVAQDHRAMLGAKLLNFSGDRREITGLCRLLE